jgi:NAD(P)-dependent dehydrogenase (short-subunit alcohol dehydrogenase family)
VKLKNEVAIVTGASRGVGLAIAREFAKEGARLAICSRSEGDVKLAAKSLGKGVFAAGCDATHEAQVRDFVEKTAKQFGRIDILVNNAGDAVSAPLEKTKLELWNEMISMNLTSVFLFSREVYPIMRKQGDGRIINIGSIAGKIGGKYIAAYSASKHGVIGFTKSLAMEGAEHGIKVNAICPGYLDTPLTERSIKNITEKTGMSFQQARRMLENENPQRRLIPPEEVASIALFLASREAGGITGEAINVW